MTNVNAGVATHHPHVHRLYKDITYSDDGTTVSLGWLPANSVVLDAGVNVTTAFDGDATNTLDIGYRNAQGGTPADDTDEFATDLALGTAGIIAADELATAAQNAFSVPVEIVGVVVSTASASAGAGTVWMTYIVKDPS